MSVENPYDKACCFDKFYHLYLSKFLRRAFKNNNIPNNEYYRVPEVDKVENLYAEFERCYNKYKGKRNSVRKALWLFGRTKLIVASICILTEASIMTATAFLLGGLLSALTDIDENPSDDATLRLWGCFVGILVCTFVYPLMHPVTFFTMYQLSYKLRIVLTVLIYRKVLHLKNYMLCQTNSGEVLNIISTDLGKVDFLGLFIVFFLVFPIYFVGKVIASYFVIGWPGVLGCSLYLVMIPIQLAFTSLFSKFRTNGAKYGDARVKLMREVIEGIRVIIMYVWEII
ncbi:ATP-binding cassette sub-family C member 4-like [Convolutriloba macropyga]|uniref:ATP-binding cassette sub-family C member 4-like n=1 Tax=Convolutriloba macropyga TaxID=536237 RepID=UPI003F51F4DB